MYQYYDENPDPRVYVRNCRYGKKGQKRTHNDCVVRAMQQIWEVDWVTALRRLVERGIEFYTLPNTADVWQSFCRKTNNYTVYKKNGKRKLLSEIAKETKGDPQGYIVRTRQHIVFVRDGKYFDNWDSGGYAAWSIWELE